MASKVKTWVVETVAENVAKGVTKLENIECEATRKAVAKRLAAKPAAEETTLSRWAHPSTGEVRVYVNDKILGRACKLFFVDDNGFASFRLTGDVTAQAKQLAESIGQKFLGDWSAMVASAR
jgi:hypothetical protein